MGILTSEERNAARRPRLRTVLMSSRESIMQSDEDRLQEELDKAEAEAEAEYDYRRDRIWVEYGVEQLETFKAQSTTRPQYLLSVKISGYWIHITVEKDRDSGVRELMRGWENRKRVGQLKEEVRAKIAGYWR